MDIIKPAPLMVGDKAFYTLSSYDAVEVSVDVPLITDEDVERALQDTVAQAGGSALSVLDHNWLAAHFEGISSADELRAEIRHEMETMTIEIAEQQKAVACVMELSKRLVQAVPEAHLAASRQMAEYRFAQQLAADDMTVEAFLAQTRMDPAMLDAMFDQQAREAAEGDAALDAYAREKKLRVDDSEIGPLLGMPPTETDSILAQAKQAGQLQSLRDAALRAKAMQLVVADCSCTYVHETPEQARARVARIRAMEAMMAAREGGNDGEGDSGSMPQPPAGPQPSGLHLV